MVNSDISSRVPCPCCGYPTLTEAEAYEICELCSWEDDGQGEAEVDEVRGGPNGAYSLAEARRNFREHLVMYSPDHSAQIGLNTDLERVTKRALVAAFDRLKETAEPERRGIVPEIERLEFVLSEELDRKVREYESRTPDPPAA